MTRYTKLSLEGIALLDHADPADVGGIRINATGIVVAGQLANGGDYLPWKQAKAGGEKFKLGTFIWRGGQIEELFPVCDRSKILPALDPVYFQHLIDAYKGGEQWRLWSDTPLASYQDSYAWCVDLYYGGAGYSSQSDEGLWLPVCGPVARPGQ